MPSCSLRQTRTLRVMAMESKCTEGLTRSSVGHCGQGRNRNPGKMDWHKCLLIRSVGQGSHVKKHETCDSCVPHGGDVIAEKRHSGVLRRCGGANVFASVGAPESSRTRRWCDRPNDAAAVARSSRLSRETSKPTGDWWRTSPRAVLCS